MKRIPLGLTGWAALLTMNVSMSVSAATMYTVSGEQVDHTIHASLATEMTWDPAPLAFHGSWNIDVASGQFSGDLYFGDVVVTTTSDLGGIVLSSFGIHHHVTGTGNWDPGALTFSFHVPNGSINGGGASVGTQAAPATCDPFGTFGSMLCASELDKTLDWEGFTVSLTFDDSLSGFVGTMQSVSAGGAGLTTSMLIQDYSIVGTVATVETPLPAAGWLLGSALLGLTSLARRRAHQ